MQKWRNDAYNPSFFELEVAAAPAGGYAYFVRPLPGETERVADALRRVAGREVQPVAGGGVSVLSDAPPLEVMAVLGPEMPGQVAMSQVSEGKPLLAVDPLKVKGVAAISGQLLIMFASMKTLNPFKLFSGLVGVVSGLLFWRYGSEQRDNPEKRQVLLDEVQGRLGGDRGEASGRSIGAVDGGKEPSALVKLDGYMAENSVRAASALNFVRSGLFLLAGWKDKSLGDTLCGVSSVAAKALVMAVDEKEETPRRERLDPRRFTDWVQRRPMAMALIMEMFSTFALLGGAMESKNDPQKLAAGVWLVSDVSQFVARKTKRHIDPDKMLQDTAQMIAQAAPEVRHGNMLVAAEVLKENRAFEALSHAAVYEALQGKVAALAA